MFRRLRIGDGVEKFLLHRLFKWLLETDLRINLFFLVFAQVFPIQIPELFRHIHVPVEVDIAVGRMIILFIKIQIRLVGELHDLLRVAAGLIAIAGIGKQHMARVPIQDAFRRGKDALHLIVDDAVVFQIRLRRLQLIVPALLHEDFLFLPDPGI